MEQNVCAIYAVSLKAINRLASRMSFTDVVCLPIWKFSLLWALLTVEHWRARRTHSGRGKSISWGHKLNCNQMSIVSHSQPYSCTFKPACVWAMQNDYNIIIIMMLINVHQSRACFINLTSAYCAVSWFLFLFHGFRCNRHIKLPRLRLEDEEGLRIARRCHIVIVSHLNAHPSNQKSARAFIFDAR